ncbi:MAG: DUF1003 domain-containing protein [Nanoarchaeota archaeon]
MLKKSVSSKLNGKEGIGANIHPIFKQKLTTGQKYADYITKFGGSWTFIIVFFIILLMWTFINSWVLLKKPFDPYPYILLNLVLSCLAAIQAPVILMSQNRQAERDRVDAKYDHQVNRKAEREIQDIQKDLDYIKNCLNKLKK